MKNFHTPLQALIILVSLPLLGMETLQKTNMEIFPRDIQKMIIERHLKSFSTHDDRVKAATQLSHVCKAWAAFVFESFYTLLQAENGGQSPISECALAASLSRSNYLYKLKQGLLSNAGAADAQNSLVAAAQYGSVEAMRLLAKQSSAKKQALEDLPEFVGPNRRTLLMEAAVKNNEPVVRFLLSSEVTGTPEARKSFVDSVDKKGKTALFLATESVKREPAITEDGKVHIVQHTNYDAAKALLERGANPEIGLPSEQDPKKDSGWTPLFAAKNAFSPDLVKLLLEKRANPNAQLEYPSGLTVLSAAIVSDGLIESHLADHNLEEGPIKDAMRAHLRRMSIEMMEHLLNDRRTDVHKKSGTERNWDYPLHESVAYEELDETITKMLIEAGADSSLKNHWGETAEDVKTKRWTKK